MGHTVEELHTNVPLLNCKHILCQPHHWTNVSSWLLFVFTLIFSQTVINSILASQTNRMISEAYSIIHLVFTWLTSSHIFTERHVVFRALLAHVENMKENINDKSNWWESRFGCQKHFSEHVLFTVGGFGKVPDTC